MSFLDQMSKLLVRSNELEIAITNLKQAFYPTSCKRVESGRILSYVAIEHAQSLKALIELGNFTSALGLLRLAKIYVLLLIVVLVAMSV